MKLSVIIPCYNHGAFLHEAIDSVVARDIHFSYEIIIVNDGSTDKVTNEIIQRLDTSKFKVINQVNQGVAVARNNGIEAAAGEYILPLDCDNKVDVGYLVDAISILDNDQNIDVVYGNALFFGEEFGIQLIGEFDFKKIIVNNYIDACAIFRRDIWRRAGGYDSNMPFMGNEDWELWIRIFLIGGKFHYLNKVCFHYRVLSNSMSVTTTRPGFQSNKNYIYTKHCQVIVDYLLMHLVEVEELHNFYNKNRARTVAKLLLGKNL